MKIKNLDFGFLAKTFKFYVVTLVLCALFLVPSVSYASTNNFTIVNGKILDPNGHAWVGAGVDLYNWNVLNGISPSLTSGTAVAQQILTEFPKLNLIRIASYNFDSPSSYATFVNYMTSRGIVVVLEDHNNQHTVLTGTALQTESNWYASLATYYINNPYVWFQTMNEPNVGDTYQMQATYNAIRATGNNTPIFMEAGSWAGGTTGQIGDTSVFTSMHNIGWDLHCYAQGGDTSSTTLNDIYADQNKRISYLQSFSSADGIMPVISLEGGNSVNGTNIDPVATLQIQANFTNPNLQGFSAWIWNQGNTSIADNLTSPDGLSLTSYGQQVASYIAQGQGPIQITSSTSTTESPYLGAASPIPGTIQAENYDNGGQNVAYYDTTPGNAGNTYRTDDVDIENSTEGTPDVGWINNGEWLQYTVNVSTTGNYNIESRVSSYLSGESMTIEMDGKLLTTVAIPNTGGYQNWQSVMTNNIPLTSGQHIMRLYFIDATSNSTNYIVNLDYLTFTKSADTTPPTVSITSPSNSSTISGTVTISANASDNVGVSKVSFYKDSDTTPFSTITTSPYTTSFDTKTIPNGPHSFKAVAYDVAGNASTANTTDTVNNITESPYSGTPSPIPGTIQSENYDNGGQNLAYYDATPGNIGGTYRTDDVDIENSTEGTPDVGWINNGEWLKYTVNASTTGNYNIESRVASIYSGNNMKIAIDGTVITIVNIPNTGGWQNWQSVMTNNIPLTAGQHILKLSFVDPTSSLVNLFNLDYLTFTKAAIADTTPPTISITSPSNGGTIGGTVTISANASDNVGVTKVEFYNDNTLIVSDTTSPYSTTLDTTTLTNGTHTIKAIAYDGAGNTTATSINVTVSNNAPIVAPSNTISPTISAITTSNITTSAATITWTTNEPATTQIEYGTSSSYGQSSTLDSTLSLSHTVTITGLNRRTTYHYKVKSADGSNNLSQSTDQTFTTLNRLSKTPKITTLSATAGSVKLSWSIPLDSGTPYQAYTGTLIMRSTTGYIQSPDTNTAIADVKAPTLTYHDTNVTDGLTYYYTLFAYDDIRNYSDPAFITFTSGST
ncbi:MAG: carbohydrate-binding protein, partial [Patescibacteria group bacterium]|nr:carbohydrate-binding protein [Patescibacteria group bacterium]